MSGPAPFQPGSCAHRVLDLVRRCNRTVSSRDICDMIPHHPRESVLRALARLSKAGYLQREGTHNTYTYTYVRSPDVHDPRSR